jgi:hypothetical protein
VLLELSSQEVEEEVEVEEQVVLQLKGLLLQQAEEEVEEVGQVVLLV